MDTRIRCNRHYNSHSAMMIQEAAQAQYQAAQLQSISEKQIRTLSDALDTARRDVSEQLCWRLFCNLSTTGGTTPPTLPHVRGNKQKHQLSTTFATASHASDRGC